MRLRVRCPAKVNWFLSVGPPAENSYHPIRSIFQAIGLFDELEIERVTPESLAMKVPWSITCDWPDLPSDNTLTKTLRLTSELGDVPPIKIHLTKKIPAQSGLGGGSSDAAGLLRALQKLFPAPIPEHQLSSIAFAVGADVPFFLTGGRAKAEGFGEVLKPLPDRAQKWLVVVKPEISVSTALAYQALDQTPRPWRELPDQDDELYNDFERVAPCECLDLLEKLQSRGAEGALLCGSGSAVFGVFAGQATAQSTATHFQAEGYSQCWAVPTLTREESLWML